MAKYTVKNLQDLSTVEYFVSGYIAKHVQPILDETYDKVNSKINKVIEQERRDASSSMASATVPGLSLQTLSERTRNKDLANEFNRQVNIEFQKRPALVKDIGTLTAKVEEALIKELGQDKYNKLCQDINQNVAEFYVQNKLNDVCFETLVRKEAPKEDIDAFMRKVIEHSPAGIESWFARDLVSAARNEGMSRYKGEGVKLLGAAVGGGTWGGTSPASVIGWMAASAGVEACPKLFETEKVDKLISKCLFNSDAVIPFIQDNAKKRDFRGNNLAKDINASLGNKLTIHAPVTLPPKNDWDKLRPKLKVEGVQSAKITAGTLCYEARGQQYFHMLSKQEQLDINTGKISAQQLAERKLKEKDETPLSKGIQTPAIVGRQLSVKVDGKDYKIFLKDNEFNDYTTGRLNINELANKVVKTYDIRPGEVVKQDYKVKNLQHFGEIEFVTGRYLKQNIDVLCKAVYAQIDKPATKWDKSDIDNFYEIAGNYIKENQEFVKDANNLTVEWRNAFVSEFGQKKYNEISQKLGGDLATLYIDYRFQRQMQDWLVVRKVPEVTARSYQREGTMLIKYWASAGHMDERSKACDALYAKYDWVRVGKGAQTYKAPAGEKPKFSNWSELGVGKVVVTPVYMGDKKYSVHSVEEAISKQGWNTNQNVFKSISDAATYVNGPTPTRIAQTLQGPYNGKRTLQEEEYAQNRRAQVQTSNDKNVVKTMSSQRTTSTPQKAEQEPVATAAETGQQNADTYSAQSQQSIAQPTDANTDAWGQFMSTLGLNDFGTVGNNLGYVIAMLPDLLIGLLTGKTKSLGIKNNLMPLASIVMGMFVKNPILKLLLVGLGGMNLFNKAGHEILGKPMSNEQTNGNSNSQDASSQQRFKTYIDEPLNPRISNPAISGNTMVLSVDGKNCVVRLSDKMVAAYNDGSLPLNVIANQALLKMAPQSQISQENYRAVTQSVSQQSGVRIS